MIKFKEFLEESLDSPVPYEISKKEGGKKVEYDFEIDKHHYRVTIVDFHGIKFDVYFGRITEEGEQYGAEEVGISVAQKVFSTVIKILKQFLKERNPKTVNFSADNLTDGKTNRSRASFYEMLLNKHLPKDYNIVKMEASFDKRLSPLYKKIGRYFRDMHISKDMDSAAYTTFTLKKVF